MVIVSQVSVSVRKKTNKKNTPATTREIVAPITLHCDYVSVCGKESDKQALRHLLAPLSLKCSNILSL